MRRQGCSPNPHSFTFLFAACTNRRSPIQGQMFHVHFIKWGFEFDIYTLTALVDMYAKMGLLPFARKLFDEMERKDVPTWNSLIAGYAKNGNVEEAFKLFSVMPSRNVISWTAMISGYSQNGKYTNALAVYKEMDKDRGVKPNEVTIASVLPACANLGALEVGREIEAYARANGYFKNMFVCNAVLEMYTKCGRIDRTMQLFHELGRRRNLCSWNTMIMGLAVHGKGDEALKLFNQMLGEGNAPDDVTFVGAILACTHGGMVAKGWELLNLMEQRFSIAPKWGGVARLRKLMKSSQITKAAGYSFIEEGGDIHKFIVEDKSHPKSNEIYGLLDLVMTRLKFDVSTIDFDFDFDSIVE
ncbi:hypothetical protein K7X08_009595 [Anisodus acutangulus]|uniref:Pentatricopeptide repeat-containing protein n=1 Tax=Anisodus acutangulus TaxID=402998 RepID=A0A9Q1N5N3_9SOLA|nr:hypothetical protein K7X08_009595 [Anisodus acutangulus]